MGVQLVKPGGHVLPAMEVAAIGLLYALELAATDTAESPTGQSVTKPDEAAELPVGFIYASCC